MVAQQETLSTEAIVFQVGDLVEYSVVLKGLTSNFNNETFGLITEVKGRKWCKVRWNDRIILEEHINDLRLTP